MGFIADWYDTASSVIRSPSKTLENETRMDGFGYPLKFMLFSVFLAGSMNTASMALRSVVNPLLSASVVDMASYFFGAVVGGPIMLALLAGIIHVFAYLLGARKGYSKTLAAIEYGTAVAPLAAVFTMISVFAPPAALISLLVGLWALQIEYRGVQHFHDISSVRAGLAIIAPILIVVLGMLGVTAWYAAPLLF